MIQRGIAARTIKTLGKTIHSHIRPSYLATEDPDPVGICTVTQKPFENLGEMTILRSCWDPFHVAARSLWRLGNKNLVIGK